MTPTRTRSFPLSRPYDLRRTLWPLRRGTGDPTMRIAEREAWWAMRTTAGAATVHLRHQGDRLLAEAWGPGATDALGAVPGHAGLLDDERAFRPQHRVIADLHRCLPGLRLTRTERLVDALIPAILEQKVTGLEARRAYRGLALALGEPAPGPPELVMPPEPAAVAAMASFRLHPHGVERRRAERLIGLCARSAAIERLGGLPPAEARERLELFPGVGPWTAAEVTRLALGDADAVSVGDFHVPNMVAWALAGEARGDDARMLKLLEPYAGQRGRVQRLLEAGNIRAPRYGPRADVRAIGGI